MLITGVHFGLQAYFEARKGKLGLFLDPTYMKLSSERTVGAVKTELDHKYWLIEFGALYEIWATEMGEGKRSSLDLFAGGRYNYLDSELSVPGVFSVGDSSTTVDPIIGARFRADLHARVPLLLRGDVGGFGIGSEGAWQLLALLGYRVTPTITLWGGYRALDVDIEEGDRDARFEVKTTTSGPIVGVAFQF